MKSNYQICTRCVMDTTDPEIAFDIEGVCNYCRKFIPMLKSLEISGEEEQQRLKRIASMIKAHNPDQAYDCLLGLSGGVDSSFIAYLVGKMGLRPLAVHYDNGYDSELAIENIKNLVAKLGFDIYTYVIDWEEFKDLQRAFFFASVIDIEMLSDHAITAAMFKLARKHKIKYVLSGTNIATESGVPESWCWHKQDLVNIKAIHARFGDRPLNEFPTFSSWQRVWSRIIRWPIYVEILNHINYKKMKAIEVLKREFKWRYYGDKHYESIFTKFYQAYVLPNKFGIDKRRPHLSSLIRNGEITRNDALTELENDPYDPAQLEGDKEYVLKKLSFTEEEFKKIMNLPVKSHLDYPSDRHIIKFLSPLNRIYHRFFLREGRAIAD